MTAIDIWAALAAAVVSMALGLRANFLKPQFSTFKTAPDMVWLSIVFASIAFGAVVASIIGGGHAGAREAGAYTAVAIPSVVLLINLAVNGRSTTHVDRCTEAAHL